MTYGRYHAIQECYWKYDETEIAKILIIALSVNGTTYFIHKYRDIQRPVEATRLCNKISRYGVIHLENWDVSPVPILDPNF